MEIVLLKTQAEIEEGLRSLTQEFIVEHSYYDKWIAKHRESFLVGRRVIYSLCDKSKVVGYMMLHFFANNGCVKINGIYVFPDFQKRGFGTQAFVQILEELKNRECKYAYLQTRLYNQKVLSMCKKLNFNIIGKNYHSIEEQDNWVIGYDLKGTKNYAEMIKFEKELYSDFRNG